MPSSKLLPTFCLNPACLLRKILRDFRGDLRWEAGSSEVWGLQNIWFEVSYCLRNVINSICITKKKAYQWKSSWVSLSQIRNYRKSWWFSGNMESLNMRGNNILYVRSGLMNQDVSYEQIVWRRLDSIYTERIWKCRKITF